MWNWWLGKYWNWWNILFDKYNLRLMVLIFHLNLRDGPYFREVLELDLVLIYGLGMFNINVGKTVD